MDAGEHVADRFEVLGLASQGGMGAVYRARDRRTGQTVALKVLLRASEQNAARFDREVRLLAALHHPAIVRYVAHGHTPDGAPYLVMEWLEGPTLSARLQQGALPMDEVLTLAQRLAGGLGAAHERGIVHRDIKPSNVVLVGGAIDAAMLVDFGVARQTTKATALTAAGAIIGTPSYMAPEQARGERRLDARADVFSLGCVLYECVTGHKLFSGHDVMAVLAKVLLAEAPRLVDCSSTVPHELGELVERMLSKSADRRPSNGRAVCEALLAAAAKRGDPSSATHRLARAVRGGVEERDGGLMSSERRAMCLVLVPSGACGGAMYAGEVPTDAPTLPAKAPDAGTEAATTLLAPAVGTAGLSYIVARHGGRLDVLVDGSRLVTFPQPGSATSAARAGGSSRPALLARDRAAQAARCALELMPALHGTPVAVVVGWASVSGQVELTEAIDRGAALLRVPLAAEVRLDPTVAGLIDSSFEISVRDGTHLLHRERPAAATARTLLGKPTACVGRARELGVLLASFDECVAESFPRAVVVTGEAGIGKTRLRQEFVARVRAYEPAPAVVVAQAGPMSAGAAFGLIADALHLLVGGCAESCPDARRAALVARVSRHLPPTDAQRVCEFLGELLATPFGDERSPQLYAARQDPRLMGDQIRRACEDFLRAECEVNPTLLVLEDLHWGDLPSVRLVEGLLRNLASSPLLVLLCGRPEALELVPSLLENAAVTHMPLGGLSRRSSEKLVRDTLAGGIGATQLGRIVDQADGNAFFLEELIRASVNEQDLPLPETVVAMAEARIHALDAVGRRVLRAASIFGSAFSSDAVGTVLAGALSQAQLRHTLEDLVRMEVLSHQEPGRGPDQDHYSFRHALVRQAAYASLTDPDRVLGHKHASEWLERRGGADPVALAVHCERGQQLERAARWFLRSAEQALEGEDLQAALQRADRAMACGAQGDERTRAQLVRAEALYWRGQHTDALDCASAALRHAAPSSLLWFAAAARVAQSARDPSGEPALLEVSRALLAARAGGGATEPEMRARAHAAGRLYLVGAIALGDQLLEAVVGVDGQARGVEPATTALAYRALAIRAGAMGELADALVFDRLSVSHCEAAGDLRQACIQRNNLATSLLELGCYAEAIAELEAVVATSRRLGLDVAALLGQATLAGALGRSGAHEEAIALGLRTAQEAQRCGQLALASGARIYVASAMLSARDLSGAEAEARFALQLAPTDGLRVEARAALARVLLAVGRIPEACAEATQSRRGLESLGTIEDGEATVRLVHAEVLEAAGEHAAAREAIRVTRAWLLGRAAHIGEPRLRQSFLEAVVENARILLCAAAWLGETACGDGKGAGAGAAGADERRES